MVALLRDRNRRASLISLAIIAVCGLFAAYASVQLSGTKTGAALAIACTAGPALLYAALIAPLAFPFALYTFLVPFDNILDFSAFGTLTRLLGAASAAVLLFYMLRTKRFVEPPRATVFWILLFLWMIASMFWAIDLQTAQGLLSMSVQLFGLYLVVSMVAVSLRDLRFVAGVVAAGGIVGAVLGIYMYYTGQGIFDNRLIIRTDSSVLNPDHFAASLILPLFICLVGALWTRSSYLRVLGVGGAGLILATIVLTGSRGATMGVAGALVFLLWKDRHRIWLAAVSVGMGAVIWIASGSYFMERWSNAVSGGGAGRTSIWATGLAAFKENWIYGAGYGSFPFAYDRVFITTFQPDNAHWHRASHNIILGYSVELGIIGLVLLLLAWWGQYKLLSGIQETDTRFPLALALQASIVGLFICGLFADIMIEKYVWLAFMLVVLTYHALPSFERRAARGIA